MQRLRASNLRTPIKLHNNESFFKHGFGCRALCLDSDRCSHFFIAFIRTLIVNLIAIWFWSTCSQTPKADHDCDRLVHKLQKSVIAMIDLFTNSKNRSLFTSVCDRDQIRSESDYEHNRLVFAVHLTYVCTCVSLQDKGDLPGKHLFSSFRAFL